MAERHTCKDAGESLARMVPSGRWVEQGGVGDVEGSYGESERAQPYGVQSGFTGELGLESISYAPRASFLWAPVRWWYGA